MRDITTQDVVQGGVIDCEAQAHRSMDVYSLIIREKAQAKPYSFFRTHSFGHSIVLETLRAGQTE